MTTPSIKYNGNACGILTDKCGRNTLLRNTSEEWKCLMNNKQFNFINANEIML